MVNKIDKIIVEKVLTDEETKQMSGQKLPKGYYKKVIDRDADVYRKDDNGELHLLMRFRKNVLPQQNVKEAYENVIKHARLATTLRGKVAGKNNKKNKDQEQHDPVMSNIIGYFDTFSLGQKYKLNLAGMKIPPARHTKFLEEHPDKWKKLSH